MKKWKEIKDKPITWGSYLKASWIASAISIPFAILNALLIWYPNEVMDFIDDIKGKFRR